MKRAATLVRRLWKETGETFPLQSKDAVGAIYAHSMLINEKAISSQLHNNVVFYDQFVIWLVQLATALNFAPELLEKSKKPTSYRFLVGAICSFSLSIRHLVCFGHDVAAKILVRSLSEYIDVLALLIARPELTSEFEQEDFTTSNEFWHRHVKGVKARRALWNSLGAGSEQTEWYREITDWRKQEDTILSIAAHPSYVAAVMSTFPLDSVVSASASIEGPGFIGHVTDASIRTLVYAMYSLFMLVALSRFPFGEQQQFEPLIVYDEKADAHRHIPAGRHVLMGIIAFLSDKGADDPSYCSP
jgi:hypothetical protein